MSQNNDIPKRIPLDIKPCWYPVIRQLQSKARSNGLAILTVTVLVNADGEPQHWLPPIKTEIHPKANADDLLKYLESMNVMKRQLHGNSKP